MGTKKEETLSFKELVLLYHKLGHGDIAKTYSPKEENKFYNLVSSKLSKKYPKFVNHRESYELLKDNGQIVTINTPGKRGFYDEKRNIIGVKHYLTRLTTTIFHEIVHKLSYLVGNGEIYKLPEVYREAGTEYITAETLKTRNVKACVLSNIWGIFPNTISSYYLDYIFVNQLNTILGGHTLEESILKGNLSFENKMKEQLGKLKYDVLTKRMTGVNKDFYHYSAFYNINSPKENEELKEKITSSIDIIQHLILTIGFDDKIASASTPEEARKVLNSLLRFSDLRLRKREDEKFVDREFQRYFCKAKKSLSERFPEANLAFRFLPNDWEKRFDDLEKIVQVPPEEEREIKREGKDNYNKYKDTFFRRIFGVKPEEENESIVKTEVTRNFNEELKVKKLNVKDTVKLSKTERIKQSDKPRDVN